MVASLPSDIICEIARLLPQNDLLHFAFMCKRIYSVAHSQIYLDIIIDSTKRVYNDDGIMDIVSSRIQKTEYVSQPVIIRSLFALTRFLKTLVAHPEYAGFIHALIAQDLFPDIPEFELQKLLRQIFPYLLNLKVLDWYLGTCPLKTELLSLLPYPENLQSLCGNFYDLNYGIPKGSLPRLRFIDFSKFGVSESLRKVDFAMFPNVKYLTLSRTASSGSPHFSSKLGECCRNSIEHKTETLSSLLSLAKSPMYVLNLFSKSPKIPLRLHSLVLRDVCVTMEDARTLLANIDGLYLNHLSLDNCFESLFGNSFDNESNIGNQIHITRRTPPPLTFLDVLSEGLEGLQTLNIGLSNEMCYNAATFNFISRLNGLSKLSVHVKNFCARGPINLAPLIESIQAHKDTLKYLNICSDVVSQIAAPLCPKKPNYYELKSIVGLANLQQLKVLRLPVKYSQIQKLPESLSQLKNIKIIQLLVTDLSSATTSSSCNGCVNSFNYAVCNTSSLIAQDYFSCASPFAKTIEEEKNQHYMDFAITYKNFFQKMSYLRFDLKNLSLVFKCSSGAIALKDLIYSDRFDNLVNEHLN